MPEHRKIRVFIAEDHEEVFEQYAQCIKESPEMELAGHAKNGAELYDFFKNGNNGVDVLVVDIGLPQMDGLTALGKIKSKIKALVISGLNGRNYGLEAIRREAHGFFAKFNSTDELLKAIKHVHENDKGFYYMPDPTDPAQPPAPPKQFPPLTPVEMRTLRKLVDAKSNKVIAEEMKKSIESVQRLRRLVMKKFAAQNAVDLGYKAAQYGILGESADR